MAQIRLVNCSRTHAEDHLVSILQVGNVSSHTGNKTCSAVFINVSKGKGLNIFKHGFP